MGGNMGLTASNEVLFGPVLTVTGYDTIEEAIKTFDNVNTALPTHSGRRTGAANRLARRFGTGLAFVNNSVNSFLGEPFRVLS